ncbi:MAG: hypothetical protein AB8C95_10900 [Phycisphaeraceae bacterium]
MPHGPDYILKIDGLASPDDRSENQQQRSSEKRPWIAVNWQCCSVYTRIYRNRQGSAYEGRCPKCGTTAKAAIGSGGTANRFFNAG